MIRRELSRSNLEVVYQVFENDGEMSHIEVDHIPSKTTVHYDDYVAQYNGIASIVAEQPPPPKTNMGWAIGSAAVVSTILTLALKFVIHL